MRLLHICPGNLYGGIESMLVTIARSGPMVPGLSQDFAICFGGRLEDELRESGATPHALGVVRASNPWKIWKARRRLRSVLSRHSHDVVICHSAWSHAIFGPVARSARRKLVFWLHDAGSRRHCLDYWARATKPDLVICNSQYTASTVRTVFRRTRREVLYCPVGPPSEKLTDETRLEVRRALSTPECAPVILQASRLEEWKGHRRLLEAAESLHRGLNWHLWVAGGAQRPKEKLYLNELRELSASLGIADRVRFVGERRDIRRLMAAADLFVQPNTAPEPFGIALIESLYAQRAVVTSDLGGAREIINESCGVRVDPKNSYALRQAVLNLLENDGRRITLGLAGPRRAAELCDPVQQLSKMEKLLRAL